MTTAEQAYLFRHGLLREAAYALHLPSERSALHVLAIDCLSEVSPDADAAAAELARHAMRALDGAASAEAARLQRTEIAFRERAAAYALSRDATAEVVEHRMRLAELPLPGLKARMDCLAQAGSLSMGLGWLAKAEQIAWRMNQVAREAGDAVQEARSLRALMAIEATIGKPELADKHLTQSLEILERHGDRSELCSTLRAFALHCLSRGRYADSQGWIDRALNLVSGNEWEVALLYDTQGTLNSHQGRYAEALDCYHKCIDLSLKLGNHTKARDTRLGVATCLLELGRLDEAEAQASVLAEEYRKAGRDADIHNVGMVLGSIALRRGRYDLAVAVYRRVLQGQADEGRIWYQIDAHANLADALCQAGRPDEALQHADESLRLSLEQDSHSGIARAHWLRGRIFDELGRLTDAERELSLAEVLQTKLREGERLGQIRGRLQQVRARM